MKESILHYIWQYKLFTQRGLTTTDGDNIEIVDVGKLNADAGPDFFNAKVKIGDTVWAGNVEIHTLASDWNRHNHQVDKSYNTVILHVVKKSDCSIFRADGEIIPQLELHYAADIEQNYDALINDRKWIPCADKIADVPSVFIQSWKNALLAERVIQKTEHIQALLSENNQLWEDAFYVSLARSFGFNTNSQTFEMLAKSLPLSILGKHKNDLFQVEALLFGQAGLLLPDENDIYQRSLAKEYAFLKSKYGLSPIDGSLWKLLRLRPDNFPHVRIAQFAAIIHSSSKLFSKIIENPEIEYLTQLLRCESSEYWKTHYLFGETSSLKSKKLGKSSIYSLIINTVVPLVFCYATRKGNDELKEKALMLLEKIPAERNSVITAWQNIGMEISSAYDSQAFLQLKKMYCDDKKCLRCRIGHKVLTR
ncbi:MAG: DUF2851 family protein [Paludibacter sp.]